jgi:lysozyme family protein
VKHWTDDVLAAILLAEGWPRYTNDPDDPGGPTKGGITLATLAAWRRARVTAADVEALEEHEVRSIYRDRYIDGPRFAEIPDDLLAHQVVDAGVLHGTTRAARWLQEACGAKVDGRVGTLTLGALALSNPQAVALRFASVRIRFLGSIVAENHRARRRGETSRDLSKYAGGWANRATGFLDLEADQADRP